MSKYKVKEGKNIYILKEYKVGGSKEKVNDLY